MKIACYGVAIAHESVEYVRVFLEELSLLGSHLVIEENYKAMLLEKALPVDACGTFSDADTLKETQCEMLVSIGGDGTILQAATMIRDSNIPILGINVGRLGFLANISKSEIRQTVRQLARGDYAVEERMMLQVNRDILPNEELPFAVNEATISRKNTTSMITIKVFMDNLYLNTYWADGLIISTPTGSTGYSLSCGGPLVMPGTENFIITPIAPHNLNVRPLIISSHHQLTIKVQSRESEFLMGLDSRIHTVSGEKTITLSKNSFSLQMIVPKDHNYFSTLREKLMWGLDRRN